jgi:hypothetical protein
MAEPIRAAEARRAGAPPIGAAIAALVALSCWTACAVTPPTPLRAYPGPALPQEQYAIVELRDIYRPAGVMGEFRGWSIDRCEVGKWSVQLLPGTHVVRIRALATVSVGGRERWRENVAIRFRVQSGHTYRIRNGWTDVTDPFVADSLGTDWPVWIEDADTGDVVGGVDPSGREPVDPVPEDWEPTPPLWCDLTGGPREGPFRRYPWGRFGTAFERTVDRSVQPQYVMWFLSTPEYAKKRGASFYWWWHADVADAGPREQPRLAPPGVGAHEVALDDVIAESCESADPIVIEPVDPVEADTRAEPLTKLWPFTGAYPAAAVDFDRHQVSLEALNVPWDREQGWPFDEHSPWPFTYERPCRVAVAYGVAPDSDGSLFDIRIVGREGSKRIRVEAPAPMDPYAPF